MSIFHFRFSAADRVWIEGKVYLAVGRLQGSHLLFDEGARVIRVYSDNELDELVLAGEARVERHPACSKTSPAPVSRPAAVQPIAELSRRDREHVVRRELYCRRFLEMERAGEAKRSHSAMHRAIAIIHAEMKEAAWRAAGRLTKLPYLASQIVAHPCPPSVRTLRRALKSLEHSGRIGMATGARTHERAK